MISPALKSAIIRHQVFLERLKSGHFKETAKALEEAQIRLLSILQKLEDQRLSDLSRRAFADLAKEMQEAEMSLMTKELSRTKKALHDFTAYEIDFEVKAADRVLRNASLTAPDAAKTFRRALQRPAYAGGDLLEPFLDNLSRNAVRNTNRMLNQAYNEGWTVQETMQRLRGTKARNYRDGVAALTKRQAEAVVRTSLQSVSSTARFQTWADNSDIIDGYEWVPATIRSGVPTPLEGDEAEQAQADWQALRECTDLTP